MNYLAMSMQRVVEAIQNDAALLRLAAAKFESEAKKLPDNDPNQRIFKIKRVVALAESKGQAEAASRMDVVLKIWKANKEMAEGAQG